ESVPWSGVTGKPSTFPPDEHGHTFIGLTDTPSSYSGQGNKFVKVKSDSSGLEFGDVSGGAFLQLTDTPSSYSGYPNCPVVVSPDQDSLIYGRVKIASVARTTAQSIPNNTWTLVSFGSATEVSINATPGYWSSSDPEYIYLLDRGIFLFLAQGPFASNSTGYRGIRVFFGGTSRTVYVAPVSGTLTQVAINCLLNAGSTEGNALTVEVIQTSGGALNLNTLRTSLVYLSTYYSSGNFII
ncbi:MAG: hypothetical protein QXT73_08560, partial [Candidatus Methanomethylicaceae archaeon]